MHKADQFNKLLIMQMDHSSQTNDVQQLLKHIESLIILHFYALCNCDYGKGPICSSQGEVKTLIYVFFE